MFFRRMNGISQVGVFVYLLPSDLALTRELDMKRYIMLVVTICAATAWSAIASTDERKPKFTLKISANAKNVKVEMPHLTATAQELIYDQDRQSLLLSGSRENPVRVTRDYPNNKQELSIGEQFTVSIASGQSVRAIPPEVPAGVYQKK
jgi:hypothetical protein